MVFAFLQPDTALNVLLILRGVGYLGYHAMHWWSRRLKKAEKKFDGFPAQSSNVNQLFTLEAGSIGRALLNVDSGYEAYKAREFLKANHPEFLS